MTWQVDKDKLLKTIDILALVPPNPGVPSSEFFKVIRKENVLTLSVASVVTGQVKLAGTGTFPFKRFYLDRKLFIPFVQASKDLQTSSPFVFEAVDEKTLLVIHGSRRAQFCAQEKITGYGIAPKDALLDKVVLDKTTRNLIYCARDIAPNDPSTPHLNCVFAQPNGTGLDIFATNQKVIFHGHAEARARVKIPFPLNLVPLLGSDALNEIHWRETIVSLNFDNGHIWQPISAKAKVTFPTAQIKEAFNQPQTLLFRTSCEKFGTVINRMCSYLGAVRREDWILKLSCGEGHSAVALSCEIPNSLFKERLKVGAAIKPFKMNWPLNMLAPVFEYLATDKKHDVTVSLDKTGKICMVKAGRLHVGITTKEEGKKK